MNIDFKPGHYVSRINESLLCVGSGIPNFSFGVEIVNDDFTPMNFVIETLKNNLTIKETDVVCATLVVHTQGRVVIAVENKEDAFSISEKIVSEARNNNYPLICRPYCAQQGT